MANRYNVTQMKNCAEAIERELKNFRKAKQDLDQIVATLDTKAWNDDTFRRFEARYNKDAKSSAEQVEKLISDMAKLMHLCSRKYSNAIDNGNANLSV